VILTKEQRAALKAVFDRRPAYVGENGDLLFPCIGTGMEQATRAVLPIASYRQFRRTVRPYFGGDCILVPWCGMWLGIEEDGYTHS
jgi:hypothetical protein